MYYFEKPQLLLHGKDPITSCNLTMTDPATAARQRERALSWIANSAKRDLYAVGALIRLTDPAQRTLDASIIGRNLRVVDSQQGARAIDVFQAQ